MDVLIGNLQIHETNKNQEIGKKEIKRDKSLALIVTSGDTSEDDEDTSYLTRRFQKLVRKNGGFRKTVNSNRTANANYVKIGGEKDKRSDLVPEKSGRKPVAYYVVKKALEVWGDTSSDLEESEHPEDASMLPVKDDDVIFDEIFAFMEKFDDEEAEKEVTLSDFKKNLHVYFVKRLRNLAVVLINSITELTTEMDVMNNSLDMFHDEKVALVSQICVVEERMMVMESENLELREKLSDNCARGKSEASSLQLKLETSLNTSEIKLAMALEINDQLERDLVSLKDELKKSLK
ncbi:hypothetical protein R3W88_011528 [Solanum pinnatisectum]|uniref:Uncharacterized protein n=1 Tax=Solanum pinnatisectum TaxID=50273 RepID=A0AAV9LA16_9SOLN|nr:hypothetical protein R3W88_011528 [Solanum pinnatisectum]